MKKPVARDVCCAILLGMATTACSTVSAIETMPDVTGIFADSVSSVISGSGDDVADQVQGQVTGSIVDWFESELKKDAEGASGSPTERNDDDRASGGAQDSGSQSVSSQPGNGRNDVQAGLALEVHVAMPDGTTRAVDPTSHVFKTGDRFSVYLRPSLSGRMTVVNRNANGIEKQIDETLVPAAGLVTLGPYEFVRETGLETLRFTLAPCTSPELVAATRDIVRVVDTDPSPSAPSMKEAPEAKLSAAPTLSACNDLEGSGPMLAQARDIEKVSVNPVTKTAFVLDPLSQAERASGHLAPRRFELTLIHK